MSRYLPAAIAAIGGFMLLAATSAVAEEWYSPVLVSDPEEPYQVVGEGLAADANGNFVAVWSEDVENSGWDYRVMFRRMLNNGAPLGAPVQVDGGGRNTFPSIGGAADGSFVIAWGSPPPEASQYYWVKTRRYDASGNPVGPASSVALADSPPRLGVNAAGNYVVSWRQSGLYARVFSADGQPLAPEFTYDIGGSETRVALSPTGTVVAASVVEGGAYLKCFTADGTVLGDIWFGAQIARSGSASLAVSPDGSITLAWAQLQYDPALSHYVHTVQMVRAAPDCAAPGWQKEAARIHSTEGYLYSTQLAASPDGDELGLSWNLDNGNGVSALAGKFNVDGDALGEPRVLASASYVTPARLAIAPGGGITAVWSERGPGPDNVYASGTVTGVDDGTRDLAISLVGSGNVMIGGTSTLTARVTNLAPASAHGVRLEFRIPVGLEVLGIEGNGWTCASGENVVCTRAALWAGGAPPVVLTVGAAEAGTYPVTASITATESDGVADNNADAVDVVFDPPSSDLKVYLFDAPRWVQVGDVGAFLAVVGNFGGNTVPTNATLEFTFEPAFRYDSVEAAPGWSCHATPAGARCVAEGSYELVGSEALTLYVRAVARPGEYATSVAFSSDIADSYPEDNHATATGLIISPPVDLALSLVANPAEMLPGAQTALTATVTNLASGSYATGFVVQLSLPQDFEQRAIVAPDWECLGAANVFCRYVGDELLVGQSTTVRFDLTAPLVVGKYPVSGFVTSSEQFEHIQDNNNAGMDLVVAVCGVSDTSSSPDPGLQVKNNPGGLQVKACGEKVHIK